jgi:hypothetical protein
MADRTEYNDISGEGAIPVKSLDPLPPPKKTTDDEVDAGRTVSTPGAAKAAYSPPPASASAELEQIRRDPNSGIYSRDPEVQGPAMRRLRQLMEQESLAEQAEEQRTPAEWAEESRARYGLDLPKLPSVIQRRDDYDTHEHDALQSLADAGVEPAVVKDLYADFHREILSGVGHLSPDQLDRLEARYAPKIGKDLAHQMRVWYAAVQEGAA